MATAPTNEHIAQMLERILRELEALKESQLALAAEVRTATGK